MVCRSNFGVEINRRKGYGIQVDADGNTVVSFPTEHSCARDIAEHGTVTLEQVGAMWLITRERVRQIEATGLAKIEDDADMREFSP